MQCSLVFNQQPSRYVTDKAKIAFVIGSLTGRALAWASSIWRSESSTSSSFQLFYNEMRKVFDHPVSGKDIASSALTTTGTPQHS